MKIQMTMILRRLKLAEYRYIVWVGGCDDYFTTYKKAKEHYDNWIDEGYDDVKLGKIHIEELVLSVI